MSLPIRLFAGTVLLVLAAAAGAVDLKSLKKSLDKQEGTSSSSQSEGSGGALGGLAMPAISGDTAGNAAGVLQYCVKRKYLSGDAVASVKDKLLSKYGLDSAKKQKEDAGYQSGLKGVLHGEGGTSFNLDKVSGKLKDKGCDYVLDNAGKLV